MDSAFKILLVDDEEDARSALAAGLGMRGYEVHELDRGAQVVETAKTLWPSLIILDIVLPDIPGTDVLAQLRANPITKGIPVLLLTAKPDIVAGQIPDFRENSDCFVEKPGSAENIMAAVEKMLHGKR